MNNLNFYHSGPLSVVPMPTAKIEELSHANKGDVLREWFQANLPGFLKPTANITLSTVYEKRSVTYYEQKIKDMTIKATLETSEDLGWLLEDLVSREIVPLRNGLPALQQKMKGTSGLVLRGEGYFNDLPLSLSPEIESRMERYGFALENVFNALCENRPLDEKDFTKNSYGPISIEVASKPSKGVFPYFPLIRLRELSLPKVNEAIGPLHQFMAWAQEQQADIHSAGLLSMLAAEAKYLHVWAGKQAEQKLLSRRCVAVAGDVFSLYYSRTARVIADNMNSPRNERMKYVVSS